jgi:hypothetical protein
MPKRSRLATGHDVGVSNGLAIEWFGTGIRSNPKGGQGLASDGYCTGNIKKPET